MKQLKDYQVDILTCGHCRACKVFNWHALEEWVPCCPAGEKFEWEAYYCVGRVEMARAMNEDELEDSERLREIVYTCTTCGACAETCRLYKGMDTVEVIEALRAEMLKREWVPMRILTMGKDTATFRNPYAESNEERFSWAAEDVKNNGANTAYFVGCTSAFREKDLAKKTEEILKKVGVNFTVLDGEEWCCGSPLLRTGHVKLAEEMAQHNVKALKDAGVDTIIFSCAGCYRTFRQDYPELLEDGKDFKLLHVTEYLHRLLKEKKLNFKNSLNMKVTYHDPCHIGRHIVTRGRSKGLYDEPRAIIKAIPGIELIEMQRNKENAWCCGAGGGVKATYGDLAVETAENRVKEAIETSAQALVSTCPFCRRNLMDAVKKFGHENEIKVYDLVELVAQAL